MFTAPNNACASVVGPDPGAGVAGAPVRGFSTGRGGLEDGAATDDDDDGAAAEGVALAHELGTAEVFWTGTTPAAGGWYSARLPGDGAADARRAGRGALGRLGCGVCPAAWDEELEWFCGSRIAPANVNGRRGPPDVAIAATATAVIAVAATDNHSVGGRTAGMPGMVPCLKAKSQ